MRDLIVVLPFTVLLWLIPKTGPWAAVPFFITCVGVQLLAPGKPRVISWSRRIITTAISAVPFALLAVYVFR